MIPQPIETIYLNPGCAKHKDISPVQIRINDAVTGGRGFYQRSPAEVALASVDIHPDRIRENLETRPGDALQLTLAYMDTRDTVIGVCAYAYDRSTGRQFQGNDAYRQFGQAVSEFAWNKKALEPKREGGLVEKVRQLFGRAA